MRYEHKIKRDEQKAAGVFDGRFKQRVVVDKKKQAKREWAKATLTQPSEEYQQWWEQNKERILEQDKLNHDMQFKSAYIKQGNY